MRAKLLIISGAVGWCVGAIVAGGYLIAAVYFCIGLRACPDTWEPYAFLFIGVSFGTMLGFMAIVSLGYLIYVKFYRDQI